MESRADGTVFLRCAEALGEYAPSLARSFREQAQRRPDQVLAAQRGGETWETLTWGRARTAADALAQALLDRGLGPDRPLMILSANSRAHLLLTLGAYTAGVPVLPISTAYSLLSHDHARIKAIAELCRPGLVFAEEGERYGRALDALKALVPQQVVRDSPPAGAELVDDLARTPPTPAVDAALDAIGPDSLAKILFTSGSTGSPKGVMNTHRMLCSNQTAEGQVWPFLHAEPPVLVDWLPWSHTFAGNHNLGQVLTFGGTLYIDDGKPTPQLFERTLEALRQISPTIYYDVPAGWALLAPRLAADRDLARTFFARLRIMSYAGAALPEALSNQLHALAEELADHPVALTSSWGATETAPGATTTHFTPARPGCIGVPIPGVSIKLAPAGAKHEIRVRGPNVTPGYFGDEAATAAAFDEEGYYRTGDAARLVDPEDPNQGLMFDGRLAEDFKLITGTWVHVGHLRTALLSEAGGLLSDAVIAGHDREYTAALAWVNQTEARRQCEATTDVALDDARLRGLLVDALRRLNQGAGSALRIQRLLLLTEPPDIDAGEITDKGYINQRAVLETRISTVQTLFAEPPPPAVLSGG